MISALHDPYTDYLTPTQFRLLSRETSSSYTGIGASVLPATGGLEVMDTKAGGPAARVGIRSGDVIVAIDGSPTAGESIERAALQVIGTQGTVYVHGGDTNLVVQSRQGVDCPDTLYWPEVHGETAGALRTEIDYFVGCVAKGVKPAVVTPEEARAAVAAVAAAERSAQTGKIVRV